MKVCRTCYFDRQRNAGIYIYIHSCTHTRHFDRQNWQYVYTCIYTHVHIHIKLAYTKKHICLSHVYSVHLSVWEPQQEQQAPKSQSSRQAKPLVKHHQSLDLWRKGYHLVAENVSENVFWGQICNLWKYKVAPHSDKQDPYYFPYKKKEFWIGSGMANSMGPKRSHVLAGPWKSHWYGFLFWISLMSLKVGCWGQEFCRLIHNVLHHWDVEHPSIQEESRRKHGNNDL